MVHFRSWGPPGLLAALEPQVAEFVFSYLVAVSVAPGRDECCGSGRSGPASQRKSLSRSDGREQRLHLGSGLESLACLGAPEGLRLRSALLV